MRRRRRAEQRAEAAEWAVRHWRNWALQSDAHNRELGRVAVLNLNRALAAEDALVELGVAPPSQPENPWNEWNS